MREIANTSKPWRPHDRLVLQGGEHWQNIYGDENVAQCHSKESGRCFHEEWLWHSCRVLRPPRLSRGGWNFPRVVSKVWKSHCPLRLGLCCRHKSTWHLRAGCRGRIPWELKQTYGRSHTCGFKWHLWNEDQASILGTACSSKPTERPVWDALFQDGKEVVTHSQQYSEFFLPICMFEGTTGTNFYPTVTSSRNGVCACCVRGMGWCPVAAWKTLGISVLATEAPQHPVTWLSGSTARVMLLAMLPCQVLQQSGSADTAGAYCCLLISGCMQ